MIGWLTSPQTEGRIHVIHDVLKRLGDWMIRIL